MHAPDASAPAPPAGGSTAPVFVVGTPRSGTTLTARILGRHSSLFMPGETHYFPDIYARRAQIGDLRDPAGRQALKARLTSLYRRYNEPEDQARLDALRVDPAVEASLDAATTDYRAALTILMSVQAGAVGKQRWGNNAPKDLFHSDDILGFYPDAQFVVCVRDVRDFLLSYKGKWRVTSAEQSARVRSLYHPVVTALLWKASMKLVPALRRRLGTGQLMVLRYEDLVTEPERAVRQLCAFLNCPYETTMLALDYSNSSSGRAGGGISSASVGGWRAGLTPEEAWLGQWLAAPQLEALGYRREGIRVNVARVVRLVAGAPFAAWRGLQANARNSGPLVPYVMRRLTALVQR